MAEPHAAAVRVALEHYGGSTCYAVPKRLLAEQVTHEYAPLVEAAQALLDANCEYARIELMERLRAALKEVVE